MKTLYLVACAKTKQPGTHLALELYTSPLFRKSVAWVKQQLQPGDELLILSAKHGATPPDKHIENYNLSLEDLTAYDRQQWALGIWTEVLRPRLVGPGRDLDRVVFLAGRVYQRELVWHMNRWMENHAAGLSWDVEDPLFGLSIGERLSWLNAHTRGEVQP